jgi:hypothetical protein
MYICIYVCIERERERETCIHMYVCMQGQPEGMCVFIVGRTH